MRLSPLILILILLVAGLVTGGFLLFSSDPQAADRGALVPLTPDGGVGQAGGPGGGSSGLELPDDAGPATAERVVALEEPADPAQSKRELARQAPPADVIWVEGRVVWPDGMPPETGVRVAARGKRFDKLTGRRSHSVRVGEDGRFKVALAQGTRIGWLTLESRWAYLEERVTIKPRELDGDVVLEPVLGGVVSGKVLPAVELAADEDPLGETHASMYTWSGGQSYQRGDRVDAEHRFELLAVPPGSEYQLTINSAYAKKHEQEVEIEAGKVTELEIQLESGARLSGRCVDQDGAPLRPGQLTIRTNKSAAADEWLGWERVTPDKLGEDGTFLLYGLEPGYITISGEAKGYQDAEELIGSVAQGELRSEVEVVFARGDSIAGKVTWPDGMPAVGASVKLEEEGSGGSWSWGPDGAARTDENGDFEITGLSERTASVYASARPRGEAEPPAEDAEGSKPRKRPRGHTWRAKAEDLVVGATDVVLVLQSGTSVSGTLTDDLGQPITRFHVNARPDGEGLSSLATGSNIGQVFLSKKGRFELKGLQPGTYSVSARAKRHTASASVDVEIPYIGGDLSLVCPRSGDLRGTVYTAAGEPHSGASITARRIELSASGEVEGSSWEENDDTNSRGEFRLRGLTAGRIELVANAEGHAESEAVTIELEAGGELTGIAVNLKIAGRMTGELHAAIEERKGRSVTINQLQGSYWESVSTDADGRFEVEGLNGGEYEVTLKEASSRRRSGRVYFSDSGDMIDRERITVVEGGQAHVVLGAPPANPILLFGLVRRGGAPAGGVPFVVERYGDVFFRQEVVSAGDGSYEVTVDGAGNYSLEVGRSDNERVDLHVEVPATDRHRFDIELPAGELSGRVHASDGTALEDIRVRLEALEHPTEEGAARFHRREASTDPEGRFQFGQVPPGKYRVRAKSDVHWWDDGGTTYGEVVLEGIVVEAGAEAEPLDIELSEAGKLRGTVYAADGRPASGVWFVVTDAAGQQLDVWQNSDGDGSFELRGLPAGVVRVKARDGERVSDEEEVRVFSGETSRLELTLGS